MLCRFRFGSIGGDCLDGIDGNDWRREQFVSARDVLVALGGGWKACPGVWCRKKAMAIWARERQWGAEEVRCAGLILQCSQCAQCERVGVNERAVGCAGCLPAQLSAN